MIEYIEITYINIEKSPFEGPFPNLASSPNTIYALALIPGLSLTI